MSRTKLFVSYPDQSGPGVSSPNRKPRAALPALGAQEPAGPRWQGAGGAARFAAALAKRTE